MINEFDSNYIKKHPKEHELGLTIVNMLGLKLKNNRVQTSDGEKTPIGLYRMLKGVINGG